MWLKQTYVLEPQDHLTGKEDPEVVVVMANTHQYSWVRVSLASS